MLINLSNHPLSSWSEKQINVAKKQFEEIVDLPFPNVPPDEDEKFVSQLAREYGDKIIDMIDKAAEKKCKVEHAVHLMGEQTFCYALIQQPILKEYDFYASTTERIVNELPNGIKQTEFKFVRFRKYTSFYKIIDRFSDEN